MESTGIFSLEVDRDNVAWLTIDQPDSRVNLLTTEVMEALDRRLGELESRIATGKLVAVVIRSGKPGTFVAGADVREIAEIRDEEDAYEKSREGQRIFRRLERLRVPTIAAVDGTCLGGGTELILACDHRIASDRAATKIGLPEVRLGILPGFGGSVRLPRLIGLQAALEIILAGKSVSASKAGRLGLVDRVVEAGRFAEEVETFVRDVLSGRVSAGGADRKFHERLMEDTVPGRNLVFRLAEARTRKRVEGRYPAPLKALEVIRDGWGRQLDEALEIEARGLAELVVTEVSQNLVRLFLLRQGARRALPDAAHEAAREVRKAAVVGAGVMGGSIAELIASVDVPVVLKDVDRDALDSGLRHAHDLLRKGQEKGVFSPEEVGLKFALIQGTLEYDRFDDVDLVIEAVVERMPVKQQVLREVEERVAEAAVFTTNTSSLSVEELAEAAEEPERVLGLHFFNPVHKMPLVEVVRTDGVSDRALGTAFRFALDLDKTPVLVRDRPGFLVNRVLAPYLNEAGFLLEEGAAVEELDDVLTDFGMPMGPCRLLDEIGFDVAEHVAGQMEESFGERMAASPIIGLLRQEGRLGRKNGRGFYTYDDGEEKGVDREVQKELTRLRRETGEEAPGRAEIRDRCLYLLVNEATLALEEGVVRSADDVDLAMVTGTGFPPFRGGLLRWADREGLERIVERLEAFRSDHGERFAPSPRLRELAESGGTLTEPA